MSNVLESVLSAIRGKRQDAAKSIHAQYHAMVSALARGEQVDLDSLASTLDSLDKSDKDLSADVERQQQRFTLAERLARKRELDAILPKLTATHEKASRAWEEAFARLQPAVKAASDALRAADVEMLTLNGIEAELLSSCSDPVILELQADLDARRMELAPQMRAADDAVTKARGRLSYQQAKREEVIRSVGATPETNILDWQSRRDKVGRQKIAAEDAKVAHAAERLREAEAHREPIVKQMRALADEQRALGERKLVP